MLRRAALPSLWWLAGPLLLAWSHDAPRDNPLDPQLTPPVQLQVALDDTAGTATLTWTRYEGEAEFGEYWVLRATVPSPRSCPLTSTDAGQRPRESHPDSGTDTEAVDRSRPSRST